MSSTISPLDGGRGVDVEVDDVGRQPLGGDLEGGARARRRLEEQVEDRLAAQQRHFLDFALGDADEGLRGVEDLPQDVARQALDRQQMVQLAVGVELRVVACRNIGAGSLMCAGCSTQGAACRVGVASRSMLCSGRRLSSVAPTNCAAIGSSRPPRSTSAASRMLRRAAVVEQLVHRGADGAPGVEHVVDQDEVAALDFEGDVRRLDLARAGRSRVEIVAVERDVERAERDVRGRARGAAARRANAAGVDADQRRSRGVTCGRICAVSAVSSCFGVGQLHRRCFARPLG